MADTTTSLQINRPGQQGQQYGTVATGFEQLDQAVAQRTTVAELTAGDHSLTAAQFRYAILVIPALPANRTLTVPARSKMWLVDNMGGGHSVTVKCTGQPGQTIAAGQSRLVFFTGTDFSEVAPAPAQNANKVYAGPTNGADAVPSFRVLVPADLPDASASQKGAMSSIHYSLVNGATSAPTASTLVQRDSSGNISAVSLNAGPTANSVLTLVANTATSGNTSSNAAIRMLVGNSGATTGFVLTNAGYLCVGPNAAASEVSASWKQFAVYDATTTNVGIYLRSSNSNGSIQLGTGGIAINRPVQTGELGTAGPVTIRGTIANHPFLKTQAQDSSNAFQDQFLVEPLWADSTTGTRKARVIYSVYDATAAREFMRAESDGTAAKISFYGATAVVRQTVSAAATDAATTQTLVNDIRTALLNYGLAA